MDASDLPLLYPSLHVSSSAQFLKRTTLPDEDSQALTQIAEKPSEKAEPTDDEARLLYCVTELRTVCLRV
jgi:hypothetical protein